MATKTPPKRTESKPIAMITEGKPTPVDPDKVRERAYEIYVARNGQPGSPTLDWLEAEAELADAAARKTD